MKIVVCMKQVPDTETKIRINPEGTGIVEEGVQYVVNPYDEFAVEEEEAPAAGPFEEEDDLFGGPTTPTPGEGEIQFDEDDDLFG